jgi:two-component system chemotaxis sensor kinase CheA
MERKWLPDCCIHHKKNVGSPEGAVGMGEMDDIIKEFLIESNEGLDQLDRDLVELEKTPGSKDLLASIFRAVHTIKGTGGVLGFDKLTSVAHVGENMLSRVRDRKLSLNPRVTTVLLSLVDALRRMLSSIETTGGEGEGDYSGIIAAITSILGDSPNAVALSPDSPPPVERPAVTGECGANRATSHGASAQPPELVAIPPREAPPDREESAMASDEAQIQNEKLVTSSTIRVDVGLLDKVMNLVGELVLARNQVLQFTTTTKDATFLRTAQRLNLITTELQEGVMKTRMQPIGNIWSKFPRVVRDLALSCGKQVQIEMNGADTELDKTIIEAIKDPLTHIVRNTVDHGIELPEQRTKAGKPAEGRLSLRAFHEGGQVNIEISDDGAGIDIERVRRKAVERGSISAEHAARMSERETLNLIFLPGLTTAERVTNVSGRGVGMDVVKTNIEKIGGMVDVQSTPGHGTTLKIKIPLTLAIIPALIVTSGKERFAIPQVSLLELVRLEGADAISSIEDIGGAPVYRLRGNLLPLVDLNRELRLCSPTAADKRAQVVNIVVLQADDRQFGLVVDEINDTEEIVVKPLGKQLKGLACFAGATIMGDGEVALILDVLGIAQMANVVTELRSHAVSEHATKDVDSSANRHTWLLFRVGKDGRMATQLSSVSRLEEIPLTSVERSGGTEVAQYRRHIMPLVRVSTLLNRPAPEADPEKLQVIVFAQGESYLGLVVDEIVDIVEQKISLERCGQQPGVAGSAVIQQRVTDVLDLDMIIAGREMERAVSAPSGA